MQMSKLSKAEQQRQAVAQWREKMTYWSEEGFVPKQPVEVVSERIKGRKGIKPFTYASHARNNSTGSVWVDVYDAQGTPWSFPPECVIIKVVRPKRAYKRKTV